MTCDSGRPCKRCIQRGLDSTCEDAPEKKEISSRCTQFFLMSNHSMNSSDNLTVMVSPMQPTLLQPMPPVQELSLPTNIPNQSQVPSQSPNTARKTASVFTSIGFYLLPNHKTYLATLFQHSATSPELMQTVPEYFPELYNQHYQPSANPNQKRRTNFLSTAADLEYSTLSNILQENFGHHTTSNEGTLIRITFHQHYHRIICLQIILMRHLHQPSYLLMISSGRRHHLTITPNTTPHHR